MPRTPIDQLGVGRQIRRQRFVLREKDLITTRSGRTLLRLVLGDRSGAMPGVLFDAPPRLADLLIVGQGVEILAGEVEEFHGDVQIRIDTVAPATLDDLSEYLPVARRPIPEMERELCSLLETVRQPDLSRLLSAIFDDRSLYDTFIHAPASRQMHHACVGGLLEHTLCVVQSALSACALHEELDRDLVLTLALLHDLGKVRAFDPVSFAHTKEGSLWSHLYMSASMVEAAIAALEPFDAEVRLLVVHGILAHHGRREAGSPVVPMTAEAMVVHHADSLDAAVRGAIEAMAQADAEGGDYTRFSRMHDTRLYRAGMPEVMDD